jgi:hypothetical protein
MTFFCRSCLKHKDDLLASDMHKPHNRRTCIQCSDKIKAQAKRNLRKAPTNPYRNPIAVRNLLRLVGE